jgi:XTP/dITP diphosphohydrolase
MKKIVLATLNSGKVREFESAFKTLPFEWRSQAELNIPEIEETGLTFIENALIKARHASQLSGLPAIADDSGLCVDALNGAPGIYSARYAGLKAKREENIEKLLSALKDVPVEKRTARFYCVLVYLKFWNDPLPVIAEGFWEGSILVEPKGSEGFGYEPIFYVPTHHCSAAEISLSEKMNLSHRGKALRLLSDRILQ